MFPCAGWAGILGKGLTGMVLSETGWRRSFHGFSYWKGTGWKSTESPGRSSLVIPATMEKGRRKTQQWFMSLWRNSQLFHGEMSWGCTGDRVVTRTMLGQRNGDRQEAVLQSLSPLPIREGWQVWFLGSPLCCGHCRDGSGTTGTPNFVVLLPHTCPGLSQQ